MYTLKELQDWSGGTLYSNSVLDVSKSVAGACIDSRVLEPGNIFFALPGTKVDGHEYVKAVSGIAGLCVVGKDWYEKQDEVTGVLLVVDDVLIALQNIARRYREKIAVPIVAITGSNGKTSTKNMIREVLSSKYTVCATKGNLNNHIGLPVSILNMKPTDQVGVFELGMNHPGEILFLTEIVKPNIAVVTGIGTAHIEFFENQEGIAHEKASIFSFLGTDDIAIFPKNDAFVNLLTEAAGKAKVIQTEADEDVVSSLKESKFPFIHARHMIQNALLAIEVGTCLGVSVKEAVLGLSNGTYESGRSQYLEIENKGVQYRVIDDTYNANPDSVCAALETLKDYLSGTENGILALGALKEQGKHLTEGYQRVYDTAVRLGINTIILCDIDWNPEVISTTQVVHVQNKKECAEKITQLYTKGDVVVCKGSRSSAMEDVIEYLK